MAKIETHVLKPDGEIPNSALPLVLVRGGLPEAARNGEAACALFERNGWPGNWVYTVYPFRHFHTRGHEVLGCVAGRARIGFGGKGGIAAEFGVGDVCVIPAGVSHCRLEASDDFLVAGGYPPGQEGNIVRPGEMEADRIRREIEALALPGADPVSGQEGGVAGW